MTLVAERINISNIPVFVLRKEDELECLAGGMTGDLAVRRSVAGSVSAYAHYIDGDLVCLWGYRWEEYRLRHAVMWLLTCEGADKHKLAFGRASLHMLSLLTPELRSIKILVHAGHKTAIKWLEWLGFSWNKQYTEHFIEMRKGQV